MSLTFYLLLVPTCRDEINLTLLKLWSRYFKKLNMTYLIISTPAKVELFIFLVSLLAPYGRMTPVG